MLRFVQTPWICRLEPPCRAHSEQGGRPNNTQRKHDDFVCDTSTGIPLAVMITRSQCYRATRRHLSATAFKRPSTQADTFPAHTFLSHLRISFDTAENCCGSCKVEPSTPCPATLLCLKAACSRLCGRGAYP